jgi:hypothetical protein
MHYAANIEHLFEHLAEERRNPARVEHLESIIALARSLPFE